jgi:hypothetical protein
MLRVSLNTEVEESKPMGKVIPEFKHAERKFDAYLARRRKKGELVRVLMRPYRTAQVRAVLEVNGIRGRVYYCESQDGWRKA